MRSRYFRVIVVMGAVAVVFAGGWAAATAVESPAQREALQAPPEPLPIFADVQRGALADTISTQTEIHRAKSRTVQPEAPAGSTRGVITAVHVVADGQLDPFELVVTVNDRPLFVAPGAFGAFRAIREGSRGPDVDQLQAALRQAGYKIPAAEHTFGPKTRAAVVKVYSKAGFSPIADDGSGPRVTSINKLDGAAELVIPTSEIVFLDLTFPLAAETIPTVGADVEDDSGTITVSSGDYQATASIPDRILPRLRVGAIGVLGAFTDAPIDVTVAEVNLGDPENGISGFIRLVPADGTEIPAEWYGQSIVSTVTIETVAEDALIVPSRAVATDASGATHILLRSAGSEELHDVAVTVLGELNGLAAIEPTGASVREGDQVAVDSANTVTAAGDDVEHED